MFKIGYVSGTDKNTESILAAAFTQSPESFKHVQAFLDSNEDVRENVYEIASPMARRILRDIRPETFAGYPWPFHLFARYVPDLTFLPNEDQWKEYYEKHLLPLNIFPIDPTHATELGLVDCKYFSILNYAVATNNVSAVETLYRVAPTLFDVSTYLAACLNPAPDVFAWLLENADARIFENTVLAFVGYDDDGEPYEAGPEDLSGISETIHNILIPAIAANDAADQLQIYCASAPFTARGGLDGKIGREAENVFVSYDAAKCMAVWFAAIAECNGMSSEDAISRINGRISVISEFNGDEANDSDSSESDEEHSSDDEPIDPIDPAAGAELDADSGSDDEEGGGGGAPRSKAQAMPAFATAKPSGPATIAGAAGASTARTSGPGGAHANIVTKADAFAIFGSQISDTTAHKTVHGKGLVSASGGQTFAVGDSDKLSKVLASTRAPKAVRTRRDEKISIENDKTRRKNLANAHDQKYDEMYERIVRIYKTSTVGDKIIAPDVHVWIQSTFDMTNVH